MTGTDSPGPVMPIRGVRWDGTVPELGKWEPTDTGRRRRGELEEIVDMLCKRWIVVDLMAGTPECTSEWLAAEATKVDGKSTSTGGVTAILRRWANLGYAQVEDKPTRFVALTADGMARGRKELARRARVKAKGTTHYQWPDK